MSEEKKPATKARTSKAAKAETSAETTGAAPKKATKASSAKSADAEKPAKAAKADAAPKKTATKAASAKKAETGSASKTASSSTKAAAAKSDASASVAKKVTKKVKPAKEKGPKIETNIQLSDRSAVIATGGKQYVVRAGDRISIERLTAKPGETTSFDALLVSNGAGEVKVGKPLVAGASVAARVMKHFRDDKKIIYKKRRRKGYDKKTGHRQELTEILIEAVQG